MIRFGLWFLIISAVIWIGVPVYSIINQSEPNIGFIISAVIIGFIGSASILVGVIKDRYYESKEDKKNDDYRKY